MFDLMPDFCEMLGKTMYEEYRIVKRPDERTNLPESQDHGLLRSPTQSLGRRTTSELLQLIT